MPTAACCARARQLRACDCSGRCSPQGRCLTTHDSAFSQTRFQRRKNGACAACAAHFCGELRSVARMNICGKQRSVAAEGSFMAPRASLHGLHSRGHAPRGPFLQRYSIGSYFAILHPPHRPAGRSPVPSGAPLGLSLPHAACRSAPEEGHKPWADPTKRKTGKLSWRGADPQTWADPTKEKTAKLSGTRARDRTAA